MIEIILGFITILTLGVFVYVVEKNARRSDSVIKFLTEALKAKDLNDLVYNRKIESGEELEEEILTEIPIEQMDDNDYLSLIKKQLNKTENNDNM